MGTCAINDTIVCSPRIIRKNKKEDSPNGGSSFLYVERMLELNVV
ncbi:hypothetical protein CP061683_1032 [Chlamydia psittaci 06-1683]|nr:hypothetical protein CP061683_1032 [Chlamydia psittaci 06-1683]